MDEAQKTNTQIGSLNELTSPPAVYLRMPGRA